MLIENAFKGLTDPSQSGFAEGLSHVLAHLEESDSPCRVLADAIEVVACSSLSGIEQRRRVGLLIRNSKVEIGTDLEFIARLSKLPGVAKSAMANALPPSSLPVLYGHPIIPRTAAAPHDDPVLTKPIVPPPSISEVKLANNDNVDGVVAILSGPGSQACEANLALLRKEGLQAYRIMSESEIDVYLARTDVIGIIVDGTFWADKPADEQTRTLERLVAYSSLVCMLVDTTAFHDAEQINRVIEEQRFSSPNFEQMLVRESSRLSACDVPHFQKCAAALNIVANLRLLPSDLSLDELVTAVAAVRLFFRQEIKRSSESLTELRLGRLSGGKSPAKLFLIYCNGYELPVVAKIGSRDIICDEYRRFRTYIGPWDNHLKPFAHFHATTGVIIFGLVEDANRPFEPAPSLEDKIIEAWQAEIWQPDKKKIESMCLNIGRAIERTCQKLARLNSRPCGDAPHPTYTWLRGSGMRALSERGVVWDLPGLGDGPIQDYIQKATSILSVTGEIAVVHGDAHLRNILVRDDCDPYLMDYAFSGPGHPSYDLVLLECALTFRFFRQIGTEDDFVSLQRALSIDLLDEHTLRSNFGHWWSSELNSTLLSGAILCRDTCLDVLKQHKSSHNEYVAAKFTLCCHSLALPDLQSGLLRGTIRALAPELREPSHLHSLGVYPRASCNSSVPLVGQN